MNDANESENNTVNISENTVSSPIKFYPSALEIQHQNISELLGVLQSKGQTIYFIENLEWDLDEEDIINNPNMILPESCFVAIQPESSDNMDEIIMQLDEALSSRFGFTHNGYSYTPLLEEFGRMYILLLESKDEEKRQKLIKYTEGFYAKSLEYLKSISQEDEES